MSAPHTPLSQCSGTQTAAIENPIRPKSQQIHNVQAPFDKKRVLCKEHGPAQRYDGVNAIKVARLESEITQ